MSLRPYGDMVLQSNDDGSVTVLRADPVIGVSVQLLAQADPLQVAVDPAGNLVFARQTAYRPVGFATGRIVDAGGPMLVLVCEKVW